ncbi:MAG: hypothetical protein HFG59_00980 [Lachnospiraceae bacterium]|nr:hypothetical protein [Lachnospiraceae bacterium]
MDSINAQNSYEQEVNLKDLLFVILHKWRAIIAVSVVFAVLMGGAKGALTYKSQNAPEAAEQREEAYQISLAQYENDLAAYEREIKNISDNIISQQDYLEGSVLMNLSPYDLYEAEGTLFIKTDYEIMPGMAYQNIDYTSSILQAYQFLITSASFLDTINLSQDLDTRYLQELVSVERGQLEPQKADSRINSSSFTNLLTVRVRHNNAKDANQILENILGQLDTLQHQVASDIGAHSVTVLNTSCASAIDLGLAEAQKNEATRLNDLRTSLSDRETAMGELNKPSAAVSSNAIALKSAVKYGVLGGVLGGFMIVFFVCVCFLMSDKLYSPAELRNRYATKLLGVLPDAKGKKNFIDLWLDRLEGRTAHGSPEDEYSLIAANIKSYAENTKVLLVAGCAPSGALEEAARQLQNLLPDIQVISGGNILQNVDAIQKLSGCEGVALVEQCGLSTYQSVELELEKIRDLGKEVVGVIVFE